MGRKLIIFFHALVILAFFSKTSAWLQKAPQKVQLHFKSSHSQGKTNQVHTSKQQLRPKQNAKPAPKPAAKAPVKPKEQVQKQTPRKKIETKAPSTKPIKQDPKPAKPIQELQESTISKETVAKIFEKIDKLEKITNSEPINNANIHAQTDVIDEIEQTGQISDVIQYLFELLELPGPGKVTVEMFLNRDGKVDRIEILQSENPENSQYLITELKDIVLPFQKKGLVPSSLKVCFSNLKA